MLCDDLVAHRADASGCDITPLLPCLKRAQKFVLDPEFAAVAEALSEDYSGLARVLERCRLPYRDTWVEVRQADRPKFMASGIHVPELQGKPKRVGFLLTATRDDLSAWKTHLFWNFDHPGLAPDMACSVSAMALQYDMTHPVQQFTAAELEAYKSVLSSIGPIPIAPLDAHPGWLKAGPTDRLSLTNHITGVDPDVRSSVPPGLFAPHEQRAYDIMLRQVAVSDWAGEAVYALAVIGLLNAKNAVESVTVDRTKLNRARAKARKPPFFEHKVLRIAARVQARVYPAGEVGSGDYTPMRGHFVRGHFKTRKSGVYFWHPHARGDFHRGWITKDYKLGPKPKKPVPEPA